MIITINIIMLMLVIVDVAPTLQGLRRRSDFSVHAAALQGKGFLGAFLIMIIMITLT